MRDDLATFLRDEIAELLRQEIEAQESDATVSESGADSITVTDDQGHRYTVTVKRES